MPTKRVEVGGRGAVPGHSRHETARHDLVLVVAQHLLHSCEPGGELAGGSRVDDACDVPRPLGRLPRPVHQFVGVLRLRFREAPGEVLRGAVHSSGIWSSVTGATRTPVTSETSDR